MREKTAIITSGGGMRCAYSAGAVYALATKLGITDPDIFISASGSVGNMFYYLAGQFEYGKPVWTRAIPSPKFIRYFPFPKIKIDYLVDTVFKKEFPLDEKALDQTAVNWFIPVVDLHTGDTRFLSRGSWFDPYEMMRAAKAVPFVYRKHIRLGGFQAMDGDVTADIADLINKALEEGATRILCILTIKPLGFAERSLVRARSIFANRVMRKVYARRLEAENVFNLPQHAEFLFLTPSEPLPAGVLTRDPRKVNDSFKLGYDDVLAKRAEIERLFV